MIHTVFPRSVAAATIFFSATNPRRLFEGGVYFAARASFAEPRLLPRRREAGCNIGARAHTPFNEQASGSITPSFRALGPVMTAEFSFFTAVRGHHVYKSTWQMHWRHVIVRMRI